MDLESSGWALFQNPWVIGTLAGIPGGLIVAFLTRIFFSGRDKRETLHRISNANRDLVLSVKSAVSEEAPPTPSVIASLRDSVARQYGIEPDQVISTKQIADELIRDVMQSSFISAKRKAEYCASIDTLNGLGSDIELLTEKTSLRDSSLRSGQLALFAGMMTAFSTVAVVVAASRDISRAVLDGIAPQILGALLAPLAAAVAALTLSTLLLDTIRRKRKKEKREAVSPRKAAATGSKPDQREADRPEV